MNWVTPSFHKPHNKQVHINERSDDKFTYYQIFLLNLNLCLYTKSIIFQFCIKVYETLAIEDKIKNSINNIKK
jgi:hypothetical protein